MTTTNPSTESMPWPAFWALIFLWVGGTLAFLAGILLPGPQLVFTLAGGLVGGIAFGYLARHVLGWGRRH